VKFIKTHPLFTAIMAVFALLIAGEVWLLLSSQTKERRFAGQLEERLAEIDRLQRQRPAPTDANLRATREDFAQHAEVLATMLRVLNVVGPDELDYFRGEPTGRTDAYFDLAQFVDLMGKAAAEAGVQVRPNERFGFSAYEREGPEPEIIRSVYRQRRIVEYLLRALFAARPRALVGVQREEPLRITPAGTPPAPARPSAPQGAGAAGAGDIFVVDPQVSARTPGYVDTIAFRIIFSGQTASLRGFMNALAVPDLPLVVRSVEVDPMQADSTRGRSAPGTGGRPSAAIGRAQPATAAELPPTIPIVEENDARFTVTIEFFEVKIRAPQVQGS
jgi:hypothetical protein